jgi:hypothetical protein
MNLPAAAQQRKDIRKVDPKRKLKIRELLLFMKSRSARAAVAIDKSAKRSAPDLESTIHSLSSTHSPPNTKLYVTGWL